MLSKNYVRFVRLLATIITIAYQSPDIAQEIMEEIFQHLDEVENYIDDIGVFTEDMPNAWSAHCASLTKVLTLLEQNNFIVNPYKCEWGVAETNWLGYWLTPTGLKPWKKKITAVLALQRPQTVKQLEWLITIGTCILSDHISLHR